MKEVNELLFSLNYLFLSGSLHDTRLYPTQENLKISTTPQKLEKQIAAFTGCNAVKEMPDQMEPTLLGQHSRKSSWASLVS